MVLLLEVPKILKIILTFGITAALFLAAHSEEAHKDPDLGTAIRFLWNCNYFRQSWPEAWKKIPGENFYFITIEAQAPKLCAQYIKPVIFLYPTASTDVCYGGNVDLVLAHEMLHHLGLPPHKSNPKTEQEFLTYLETDAIEITMSICALEQNITLEKGSIRGH